MCVCGGGTEASGFQAEQSLKTGRDSRYGVLEFLDSGTSTRSHVQSWHCHLQRHFGRKARETTSALESHWRDEVAQHCAGCCG